MPVPAIVTPVDVQPNEEFTVTMRLHLSPRLATEFLHGLPDKGIVLEFRKFDLMAEALDDRNIAARLPLWDGIKLNRRDDVFTGRIFMMSANAGITFGGSAKLSLVKSAEIK